MQLSGKLTLEEALKARRLSGATKWYRLTLTNLGIAMFLMIPIGFELGSLSAHGRVSLSDRLWTDIGSLAFVVFIFAVSRYNTRVGLSGMIKQLPDVYDVDDAGLRLDFPNGVKTWLPWSTLSRWENLEALLFLRGDSDHIQAVLSLGSVSPTQQEELLGILKRNLVQ